MEIAIFSSNLLEAEENRAQANCRSVLRTLNGRGHRITCYIAEPKGRDRFDVRKPDWCDLIAYEPGHREFQRGANQVGRWDLVVTVGKDTLPPVFLERPIPPISTCLTAFWDLNPYVSLDKMEGDASDPLRTILPCHDLVLTYGGGSPVARRYEALGARHCLPIHNAFDSSCRFPVAPDTRYKSILTFFGDRLPTSERLVREYFSEAACRLEGPCLFGGSGWERTPAGARYLEPLDSGEDNALYSTATAVLCLNEGCENFAGYTPPRQLFEATAAGACVITSEWEGLRQFFEPGKEVLIAKSGREVASILAQLPPEKARAIGRKARRRALSEHTYLHRALEIEAALCEACRDAAQKTASPHLATAAV